MSFRVFGVLAAVWGLAILFALSAGQSVGYSQKAAQKAAPKKATSMILPHVLLKTSKGDVVLELFEDQAPNTVANFVNLVEKKFYDGLTFHRVIKGFVAQGGCPDGTGRGGPGYSIKCECYRDDHRKHVRGVISMAHAGRDTGGSQFYIAYDKLPHLDGRHTVFGRVIKGMEAVDKLARSDEGGAPDKIIQAKVLRKRKHPYKPETIKRRGR